MEDRSPILLAVTGASGAVYALKFIEIMNGLTQPVHLIISGPGEKVAGLELGKQGLHLLKDKADAVYPVDDLASLPASGSSLFNAMAIIPCSMGTLSAIAHGSSQNLIHRAADCFLKEKRKLVLAVRETPLSRIHLKNMLMAHDAGAVIFPAMPAFYNKPGTIEELAEYFSGRIVEYLGFSLNKLKRWNGVERYGSTGSP
jgi:4-hydroxy-3-polyprenylbenzoate decarboxylase